MYDNQKFEKLIVQKFGGTSVGSIDNIKNVAQIINNSVQSGYHPIVVVSAMAGVTNQLVSYCSSLSSLISNQSLREYDAVLSSGEIVTSALVSLALQNVGLQAISLSAWQVQIKTNSRFSKALIENIDATLLRYYIDRGVIPVITGFQGVDGDNNITTLGRGGSDTTAVAIAAAVNAHHCDIYTDVEGVYTADPRFVNDARKIEFICYQEMLEFASSGAKVLHARSVQIAMRYSVRLNVISSFVHKVGTIIANIESDNMETPRVTGITYNKNFVIVNIASKFELILRKFMENNIKIDVLQNMGNSCTFMIHIDDTAKLKHVLNGIEYNTDSTFAIVSVIGMGIKNSNNIINNILLTLIDGNIEIVTMTCSETKIAIILRESDAEKAVRLLHQCCID